MRSSAEWAALPQVLARQAGDQPLLPLPSVSWAKRPAPVVPHQAAHRQRAPTGSRVRVVSRLGRSGPAPPDHPARPSQCHHGRGAEPLWNARALALHWRSALRAGRSAYPPLPSDPALPAQPERLRPAWAGEVPTGPGAWPEPRQRPFPTRLLSVPRSASGAATAQGQVNQIWPPPWSSLAAGPRRAG